MFDNKDDKYRNDLYHDGNHDTNQSDNFFPFPTIAEPTGQTGLAAGTVAFNGVQRQLTGSGGTLLGSNSIIVFDTQIFNQSTDIFYNTSTGIFTITRMNSYYVSWWVSTDGTGVSPRVSFSLLLSNGGQIVSNSPSQSGQVSGTALVNVNGTPFYLALVNSTGDTVALASLPVQANIIIAEVV